MKLTLQQVIDLNYELNGLSIKTSEGKQIQLSKGILAQKTSMKLKLYLQRLNKVVADEVKLYDDAKKEIFEKYSVGEGEDKKIPEDKLDEADKEHKDLISAEKEIDVANLWSGNITIETLADIETEENYPVLLKLIDK
jgi:serine phosphatase RsbU (regulator of sigma subunit)